VTRDYKNVTEAGVKKKRTRSRSHKSVSAEKTLPGWVWLISGVVIGGFVSFIVYLKLSVPVGPASNGDTAKLIAEQKTPAKTEAETPKADSNQQREEQPQKKDQEKGELEFYKILTHREPLFPDNKTDEQNKTPSQGEGGGQGQEKNVALPQIKSSKPAKVKYLYTLQVGSFLEFKDADKRKANLALLGIGSRIHAIKTRNVTHYRVMVGPYDDLERIQKIDVEMKANNIKTLLLREVLRERG